MSEITQAHAVAMARVISDIRDERRRQVEVEGYEAHHDDAEATGDLELAAAAYAAYGGCIGLPASWINSLAERLWPFSRQFWKPTQDRRRCLIKAAALLMAAIERLDRAESRKAALQ